MARDIRVRRRRIFFFADPLELAAYFFLHCAGGVIGAVHIYLSIAFVVLICLLDGWVMWVEFGVDGRVLCEAMSQSGGCGRF